MIDTYMSRQVFPQAPSPTMTSLRRISAICAKGQWDVVGARELRPGAGGGMERVVVVNRAEGDDGSWQMWRRFWSVWAGAGGVGAGRRARG